MTDLYPFGIDPSKYVPDDPSRGVRVEVEGNGGHDFADSTVSIPRMATLVALINTGRPVGDWKGEPIIKDWDPDKRVLKVKLELRTP